jgi:hypothetical protein
MKRLIVFMLLLICALCAVAQTSTAKTQVVLTTSSPVSLAGTLVTFAASVYGTPSSATPTSAIPTGTVTFLDGTTPIGAGALQNNQGLATAVFYTSALAAGSHSIAAQFPGDANFPAAVSAVVTVAIESYSITPAATSLTLKQGQSGTILYTVADAGSFSTSVQFACQPPANSFTSCTFSPATLSGNGQAALTISTTGSAENSARDGGLGLFATGSGALACLLLCWSPVGARFRRRLGGRALLSALILALFLCGIAALSGCGGASAVTTAATPTGTQTFEVITAATANQQTIGQNTWVTVNILPAS